MNGPEYVTMTGVDRTREIRLREDRYTFAAKHKWSWVRRLQVKAFELLRRHGALTHAYDEVEKFVRVPLDGKSVMDLVWRVRGDQLRDAYRAPSQILIGAVDYEDLIGQPGVLIEQRGPLQLRGEIGFDGALFAIPIKVIPQMRGVVVLP